MRHLIILVIFIFTQVAMPSMVFAQPMMREQTQTSSDNHTAREEAEGKAVWEKLQAKEVSCDKLSDDNFETLGEYFMGKMVGNSHEAMNNMMVRMMGEEGEKQTHIAMGKRNSGCDTSATFPQKGVGFMPMMGYGGMMNWGTGFATFSLFFFLFWILVLVNLVLLAIFLWKKIKQKR